MHIFGARQRDERPVAWKMKRGEGGHLLAIARAKKKTPPETTDEVAEGPRHELDA